MNYVQFQMEWSVNPNYFCPTVSYFCSTNMSDVWFNLTYHIFKLALWPCFWFSGVHNMLSHLIFSFFGTCSLILLWNWWKVDSSFHFAEQYILVLNRNSFLFLLYHSIFSFLKYQIHLRLDKRFFPSVTLSTFRRSQTCFMIKTDWFY